MFRPQSAPRDLAALLAAALGLAPSLAAAPNYSFRTQPQPPRVGRAPPRGTVTSPRPPDRRPRPRRNLVPRSRRNVVRPGARVAPRGTVRRTRSPAIAPRGSQSFQRSRARRPALRSRVRVPTGKGVAWSVPIDAWKLTGLKPEGLEEGPGGLAGLPPEHPYRRAREAGDRALAEKEYARAAEHYREAFAHAREEWGEESPAVEEAKDCLECAERRRYLYGDSWRDDPHEVAQRKFATRREAAMAACLVGNYAGAREALKEAVRIAPLETQVREVEALLAEVERMLRAEAP